MHLIEALTKERGPNIWVEISLVYFAPRGDKGDSFDWLIRAFDERCLVVYVKEYPRFCSPRSDPGSSILP